MIINEFTAKKLGEVLAFNNIGAETLEKGRDALITTLGEEKVLEMQEKARVHGQEILRLATDAGVVEVTLAKAKATGEKLQAMRELYVAGKWDNATELLEWGGFFEGATIVHWALVRGCGEGINEESLLLLAQEAIDWHQELFENIQSELGAIGADRATV